MQGASLFDPLSLATIGSVEAFERNETLIAPDQGTVRSATGLTTG